MHTTRIRHCRGDATFGLTNLDEMGCRLLHYCTLIRADRSPTAPPPSKATDMTRPSLGLGLSVPARGFIRGVPEKNAAANKEKSGSDQSAHQFARRRPKPTAVESLAAGNNRLCIATDRATTGLGYREQASPVVLWPVRNRPLAQPLRFQAGRALRLAIPEHPRKSPLVLFFCP